MPPNSPYPLAGRDRAVNLSIMMLRSFPKNKLDALPPHG